MDALKSEGRLNDHDDEDENQQHEMERTVRTLDRLTTVPVSPHPTIPENISTIIRRLKVPGDDPITNKVTKELPRKGIMVITNIVNDILRQEYFPRR